LSIDLLLQEFERISDTPEAVSRLRTLITDLAVTGRLEEQDFSETPAKEAQRLARQPSASSGLPKNWVCARLGDLLDVKYGKGLPVSERADSGPVAVYGSNGVVSYTKRSLEDQPAIIVGRKGSAGALVIGEGPSWTTDVAYYIVPPSYFDIGFLFLQLKALQLEALSKGVKPGLSRSDMNPLQLAVPPLAEQHRIVARVDELMALCDRLEAAQRERESQRDALRVASLYRLIATEEGGGTESDVRFCLRSPSRLITKPEHVESIRQTILDLAVSGTLVPQKSDDQPAAELLQQLELEQASNSAPWRVRPSMHNGPSPGRNLPAGWASAAVSQVLRVTGGIQKQPKRTPAGNAFPYLGVSNVQRGRLDLRNVSRFELFPGELEKYRLEPGDLLVVEGNGSPSEIGRCTRWNGEIVDCVHQNHIIRCRPLYKGVEEFVLLYLNSPSGTATMRQLAITSAGLYSLSVGKIQRITTPVPPLAEQQRIVAKVNELLAICDELEAALDSTQHERGRLLEAVLHDALAESGRTTVFA
jgi:type I restriction enzyme S subunit